MCLAIPAQITQLDEGGLATVDILGVTRSISVDLTPQAGVGDYVLVHAGFAIEVVDPVYAEETLDLVRQFPELVGEELAEASAGIGAPRATAADSTPAGERMSAAEVLSELAEAAQPSTAASTAAPRAAAVEA